MKKKIFPLAIVATLLVGCSSSSATTYTSEINVPLEFRLYHKTQNIRNCQFDRAYNRDSFRQKD